MQRKKYRALFFDAGNTLLHVYPSVGAVYARTAEKYGLWADPGLLDQQFVLKWRSWSEGHPFPVSQSEKEEKGWWYGLVKETMQVCGSFPQFDDFFDNVYQLFTRADVWRLYPEVISVLQTCKQRGVILGIISNWDSRLSGVCRALGLAKYFDFILASAQAGYAKPHPGIFQLALAKSGIAAQQALHVGDSWEEDIKGAQQVGVDGLWVNRSGKQAPSPEAARTSSLTTLLSLC